MDSHGSPVAKAVGRALVAAITVGSLVVLLDAGAKYSGLGWRVAGLAREPSGLEHEVSVPAVRPHGFRLSANLPLEHVNTLCSGAAGVASADGDESFDSSRSGDATVNAVGDLPRAELLSLPGDWLYHRALHF